jgi:ribosomal protein L32
MKAADDLASLRRRLVQYGQLEAHTLFECSTCGDRQLGQRRCPDCQLYCRAVGLAAACTECGEFILVADLFPTEVPHPY